MGCMWLLPTRPQTIAASIENPRRRAEPQVIRPGASEKSIAATTIVLFLARRGRPYGIVSRGQAVRQHLSRDRGLAARERAALGASTPSIARGFSRIAANRAPTAPRGRSTSPLRGPRIEAFAPAATRPGHPRGSSPGARASGTAARRRGPAAISVGRNTAPR